ncbi:MAG: hypothetical protein GXY55_21730 [Phycisphaerae bacterium]|nr:hypothetical protein [Phycisphaerae bacterium]
MSKMRIRAGVRLLNLVLATAMTGSVLVSGCSLTDMRNSAVKGFLGAIETVAKTWVSTLLPTP